MQGLRRAFSGTRKPPAAPPPQPAPEPEGSATHKRLPAGILITDPKVAGLVLGGSVAGLGPAASMNRDVRTHFGRAIFAARTAAQSPRGGAADLMATLPDIRRAAQILGSGLAARVDQADDLQAVLNQTAGELAVRRLLSRGEEDAEAGEILRLMPKIEAALDAASPAARLEGWAKDSEAGDAAGSYAWNLDKIVAKRIANPRPRWPRDVMTRVLLGMGDTPDTDLARHRIGIMALELSATVALSLGWALVHLAADPGLQRRAAEAAAKVAGGPGFNTMYLDALGPIHAILSETWRLTPPRPVLSRRAEGDVRFEDIEAPAETEIFVAPWHLGRDADHWHEAERFDPARWKGRLPGQAWLGAAAGAGDLPGLGFVRFATSLLLAEALSRFDFRAASDAPEPVRGAFLRPREGFSLHITRR
ncbi:MAG: cytochrome P450 [Pseudomonadota bacterium]